MENHCWDSTVCYCGLWARSWGQREEWDSEEVLEESIYANKWTITTGSDLLGIYKQCNERPWSMEQPALPRRRWRPASLGGWYLSWVLKDEWESAGERKGERQGPEGHSGAWRWGSGAAAHEVLFKKQNFTSRQTMLISFQSRCPFPFCQGLCLSLQHLAQFEVTSLICWFISCCKAISIKETPGMSYLPRALCSWPILGAQ